MHETPVFAELQLRKALAAEVPLKTVLRDHRGAIVVSMLLTWLLGSLEQGAILIRNPSARLAWSEVDEDLLLCLGLLWLTWLLVRELRLRQRAEGELAALAATDPLPGGQSEMDRGGQASRL